MSLQNINSKKSRGFTIVELLVVVVVIGILAAITIVSYTGITARANTAAGVSAMNAVVSKATVYGTDGPTGSLPASFGTLTGAAAAIVAEHAQGVLVRGTEQHRVDAVLFTLRPCLHDFGVGEIGLEQIGDINQIPAVGITAEQVAAANHATHLDLADGARRQGGGSAGGRIRSGDSGFLGQQPIFLHAGDKWRGGRHRCRLFQEAPPVEVSARVHNPRIHDGLSQGEAFLRASSGVV